jgi:hypothetical protein
MDGVSMLGACSEDVPNKETPKSSVLQADKSGKSAAAAKQARRSGKFLVVVAALVFTLHLMISFTAWL